MAANTRCRGLHLPGRKRSTRVLVSTREAFRYPKHLGYRMTPLLDPGPGKERKRVRKQEIDSTSGWVNHVRF